MIVRLSTLAIAATFVTSNLLVHALVSPSDIPSDTPISSLLASANAHLAKGETNDALTYYDIAISRDPENYLTYFRRGATYLSLGRTPQATQDFDKVLTIKPGFEGALLQRAKIKAKNGEWDAAKKDYLATSNPPEQELAELSEAQGAAALAADAEKAGNWEECVTQSGVAIMVASRLLPLRQTRAHCRFERGEVEEGMNDLKHVLQMQPGRTDPHLQISSITYYALGDLERGMDQLRKCLHSDPDSKPCKKLYRQEKRMEKTFAQVKKHFEKHQFSSGVKLLLPSGEDAGLVQEVKDEVKELREAGVIPAKAPNELVARVVEMVCEAYNEMKNSKKAAQWCEEALSYNEHSLHGLLSKARVHMEAENFEAAIHVLNTAKEHHPGAQQINGLLQNAQVELKRSKTKDYYKVLGLPRDADELQIKAAYRRMVKIHHPDKAHKQGISKEDAEKKMAAVNEAYEVLSDPELKARFDRGDDPNDHESQRQQPFQGHHHPFGGGGGMPFQHSGGGGQQFNFKFAQGGFQFG
ncbi:TPR-like protein [Coleophoma cylindrospora]|uniref:Tetratricopeptide repeat and J domain-containing co-chaperone DNJ1 n=1 Tax=Coleophoma cylindrospora TaxID=1849047 RepID=A0A3D8R1H5_9HELO|nr:TPR-like protein [Coleophoma cylindrospora]